jgi:serine/threonine protein kinase
MELLGANLHNYIKQKNCIGGNSGYDIINQMLLAIEDIHKRGVVHQDIKSSNFVIFNEDESIVKIKIIDFGLSKIYKRLNGELVKKREVNEFRGTVSYASVSAHNKKVKVN